jgi:cadmium resistance protein CadD (predicted permease)
VSVLRVVAQAAGLFVVTNIDDIVILALFFARATGRRHAVRDIALGQYAGFLAILAVAVAAALGATLLPAAVVPYLGLLPVALGIRAWLERDEDDAGLGAPGLVQVTAVTFANGGDNIGVYVPVFATAGGWMVVYALVFVVLLAPLIAAGRFLATRPVVARGLARWGHVVLPVVLVVLGVVILVEGGAFGL